MRDAEPAAEVTAPLTPAQRRVWFLHRLDPGAGVYSECALWRIVGAVDPVALRAAIEAVAVRQPMLRTRFPVRHGVPLQLVDPAPHTEFECVDLAGSEQGEDERLAEAVRQRALRPFDLAAATPIRWTLFSFGPRRHALLRNWHHILGDAMSAKAMNEAIGRAYASIVAGGTAALPPLTVDYLDHTRRQAIALDGPEADAHRDYWKERLAGAPTLALPTDFRRPVLQSFRGGRVPLRVAREASVALRALAHDAGATMFVMLMTGFAGLLSRLSGDTDLVIGMPVAGRPPGFDEVIGFFTNTVACRVDLSGAPSAREAARQVQQRVREAVEHQHTPLETVVDALRLPRDPSRNPLFQVAFGVRRQALGELALCGATVRRTDCELGHARFDLTANLIDGPDGVMGSLEYCADLFERATVERMAAQYASLVDAMIRSPDAPLATLPLMDDATRERIVAASRGAAIAGPPEETITRRFAAQARATPEAPAVGSLSFARLDVDASRLAATLRERGVRRGAFVAVACAATTDLATAWLAVLKAGGAYLPVDTDMPEARLALMLGDAAVKHGIADEAFAPRLARHGVDVVLPGTGTTVAEAGPGAPPADDARPDDPAYAICTSGSSGRPKGVVVPHRAVVRLVCGTDYVRLGPGDAVAQLANPAFDASTFELWGALLNGARVVPIAKATALAPRELRDAIARERVSAIFVTTALFNSVARDAPDAFAPCGTVLFGGEAVEPERVADVLRAGAPRRLVHVYGPTETTTFATWHDVRSVAPGASRVPIGRAIANAEAFVLRADGEPAAPGEPGEIVIGGCGVARGYLGEVGADGPFVEASVGALPRRRLYRTGDVGRLTDDGAIEFLGRVDGQVKLRGHRIELGEIETALARVPGVREAAVVLRGETSDTRRLVAYAVPSDPNAPPPAGWRRELARCLPAVMLPSALVWLPALPLNANGKLDRRALAAEERGAQHSRVHVAPRDSLEEMFANLWARLLGIDAVGVHDGFFDIGGHSLLAARLVDEIERELGITVPLAALFVDDTIAGLARSIREGQLATNTVVVPLNERGSRLPLVYLHGDYFGGGFHSLALARLLGPDQPVYVVHPHGVAGGAIPATIEAMADERLQALRALRPQGPYVVGGHCNGAYVAFELARRLIAEGESVPAVIVVGAAPPSAASDKVADDPRATAVLAAALGIPPPTDPLGDLGYRLFHAMRGYRGHSVDVHLAIVRSGDAEESANDRKWAALASSVERHVLPGGHVSLVRSENAERFAAVIRGIVDRLTAREGRQAEA